MPDQAVPLGDDDLASCERQRTCDGEADDTCADDENVYVRRAHSGVLARRAAAFAWPVTASRQMMKMPAATMIAVPQIVVAAGTSANTK